MTTNPLVSTGDGIAMALRAGVAVADVEFMQFHPTALHHPSMPRPLLSEALRGEGAILRDEHGVAFMVGEHPLADLAPRDIVARAITRRLNERGSRSPLARRDADRALLEPVPDHLRRLSRGGPRSRRATGSRSHRQRTTSRAGSASISTGRRRCPGSGHAVRPHAQESTVRTASRRTPCSTAWSSAHVRSGPSNGARTDLTRRASSAGSRRRRRSRCRRPRARRSRPARRRVRTCSAS